MSIKKEIKDSKSLNEITPYIDPEIKEYNSQEFNEKNKNNIFYILYTKLKEESIELKDSFKDNFSIESDSLKGGLLAIGLFTVITAGTIGTSNSMQERMIENSIINVEKVIRNNNLNISIMDKIEKKELKERYPELNDKDIKEMTLKFYLSALKLELEEKPYLLPKLQKDFDESFASLPFKNIKDLFEENGFEKFVNQMNVDTQKLVEDSKKIISIYNESNFQEQQFMLKQLSEVYKNISPYSTIDNIKHLELDKDMKHKTNPNQPSTTLSTNIHLTQSGQ